jgi:cold shock CspA family protein
MRNISIRYRPAIPFLQYTFLEWTGQQIPRPGSQMNTRTTAGEGTVASRFNGKLTKWNAERGFGFLMADHGDQELFVHVSAFPRDGRPPAIGEPLSFEMELDKEGRKRAVRVRRPGVASSRAPQLAGSRSLVPAAVVLLLVAAGMGWFGYTRYNARVEAMRAMPQYNAPALLCDGRKYCSQMKSCGEAKLFLNNCSGMEMDGDRDGIPCEQDLCTGLFGG